MVSGQITLYMACSIDGFIATEDGGVGWLEPFNEEAQPNDDSSGQAADPPADGGYEAFFASVDALVMGSRTYEQILGFGGWPYDEKPTYVLTQRELPAANEHVRLLDERPKQLAFRLRQRHEHVWLVGGGQVAGSFLEAEGIDEFRLSFVPIVLGAGIRLFGQQGPRCNLELLGTQAFENGIVELHYALADV